ncbi:hypothetical protein BT96DRAFT_919114 [Gymnopus androsaceus JB14]|uniref:Uncharacterized protein n=1 Tax=Gymnopus androsaceus JB14 TaxID=1447944 RepID=A0A6A4HT68_9AGAR|nr:hypothetical protein BT96DRAFT_919114 [Gymnopus androsaceus JB14]
MTVTLSSSETLPVIGSKCSDCCEPGGDDGTICVSASQIRQSQTSRFLHHALVVCTSAKETDERSTVTSASSLRKSLVSTVESSVYMDGQCVGPMYHGLPAWYKNVRVKKNQAVFVDYRNISLASSNGTHYPYSKNNNTQRPRALSSFSFRNECVGFFALPCILGELFVPFSHDSVGILKEI